MLQNPEGPFEEWEVEIWAKTPEQARARCQRIADRLPLAELTNVTQESKKPGKQGEFRYLCWIKLEASGHDSDD